MTEDTVMNANLELLNGLLVLAYLMFCTISITLLSGWALKRFGRSKYQPARVRSRRRL